MKAATCTVVVVTALILGAATMARAGGDQNHERHKKEWGGTKSTAVQTGERLKQRDRKRDGSCVEGDQTRDRNRDRDRARDGSCQE